jgi:hypothetical protein
MLAILAWIMKSTMVGFGSEGVKIPFPTTLMSTACDHDGSANQTILQCGNTWLYQWKKKKQFNHSVIIKKQKHYHI